MQAINCGDHVVPDFLGVDFPNQKRISKHLTLPDRSKTSSKLQEYNDFFNLYNDSLCSDVCNMSDASSFSGSEARSVPNVAPSSVELDQYRDSLTFEFCSESEIGSNTMLQEPDIAERIVIGRESNTPIKKNFSRQTKKRRSSQAGEKISPLASSTMMETPPKKYSKVRRVFSRKDSGICECMKSMSPESSTNSEEEVKSINDVPFVITRSQDRYLIGNKYTGKLICSLEETDFNTFASSNIFNENVSDILFSDTTFADESFYNKQPSVPRTSTKTRLRAATPKKNEKTMLYYNRRDRSYGSHPLERFLRLFTKKRIVRERTYEENHKQTHDTTEKGKRTLVKRMKNFRNSYRNSNTNNDFCTLANL